MSTTTTTTTTVALSILSWVTPKDETKTLELMLGILPVVVVLLGFFWSRDWRWKMMLQRKRMSTSVH